MQFRIKEMRKRAGMGQKEVAAAASMPVRRYGSYEREERMLSLEDAVAIADALSCTLDELAGRTPPRARNYTDVLTAGESRLVASYRAMDADERGKLIGVADSFVAASEKYGAAGVADVGVAGGAVVA